MLQQLTRYGVVGLANNAFGFILYLVLTHYGVEPKLAMSVVYTIGTMVSFTGNRKWTFSHGESAIGSMLRYTVALLLGYLINLSMLAFFTDIMGFSHQWVQAAAIFVVAAFLFVAFKFFVFPRRMSDGVSI